MREARWRLRDTRGRVLPLEAPYLVAGASGVGIAPAEHLSRQHVYEDGEQFVDARFGARTVQLAIDIAPARAQDLPACREALYTMLAPVREGCYLTYRREDGAEREILARLTDALDVPTAAFQGAQQRVVLTLRCASPHWYDPGAELWIYSVAGGAGAFGFPLAFPRGFGASTVDLTETRTYAGQIDAYPEIRVTGPAEDLVLENLTLGTRLDLSAYAISAGEVVTFALSAASKAVSSSVAGNILRYLSDDSDLGAWRIGAHPTAPDGRNTVHVELEGATNATEVVIQFNPLYAGV